MDALPSAQFRRLYASLKEPTAVTVNGHVIGTWVPGAALASGDLVEEVRHLKAELAKRPMIGKVAQRPSVDITGEHGYSTRPFTPVPKGGKA